MTNYNTSYDTLGNYQDTAPIAEARPSLGQLETSVNSQIPPPLPRQSRKRMPIWKKVLIGGIVAGSLASIGYKALDTWAKSIVGSAAFSSDEKDREIIEAWQDYGNFNIDASGAQFIEEIRKRNAEERRKSRH
jgi:hypothetical protein